MTSRMMLVLAAFLLLGAAIAGYLGFRTTRDAQQAAVIAEQKMIEAKSQAAPGVPGKVPVVVAKQAISAYHKLTAEDLSVDYLKVAPPRTYRDIQGLLGQVVQEPLDVGMLVELRHLQPGSEVARLLKPGERAVAIPVDEVIGGGGFLQPGDLVDVLLFLRGDLGRDSAQIVMRGLRVLGFGTQLISPDGPAQSRNTNERPRTAVLAVDEKDVTRFMLASNMGSLRLAIRPPEEAIASGGDVTQPQAPGNRVVTASILQPGGGVRAAGPAVPRQQAAPAQAKEPAVMIYRGIQGQAQP